MRLCFASNLGWVFLPKILHCACVTSYSYIMSNSCLVLAANHSLVVKAENMAEKLDWMSRIRACMDAKGGSSDDSVRSSKDSSTKDSDSSIIGRSTYDGPAVSNLGGILSFLLMKAVVILQGSVGLKILIIDFSI